MIKSREERKRSTLLRRRTIIIIVSIVLVLALGIAFAAVSTYMKNVIPYVDPVSKKTYYLKFVPTEVDDKLYDKEGNLLKFAWKVFDKDGNVLEREPNFGYYVIEGTTCVEIDPETGEYYTRAVLDTSQGELPTEYDKVLIFNQVKRAQIRSIEVHNQLNSFKFQRYDITDGATDEADFVLDRLTHLSIREEVIPDICNAAGFPLAASRVDNAVRLANGKLDLSEYGLAPEKRTKTEIKTKIEKDENGNDITVEYEETVEYDYTPTYYILTTTKGVQHKMIIGDRLINDGGYYAQYVEIDKDGNETPRDKLYVLGTSIKYTLLAERKSFVTPGIAFPVTQKDYFDVTDFQIHKKNDNGTYDTTVSFSYVDIAERQDTVEGSRPYVFTDERSDAYRPNYDRIDSCLLSFMDPTIVDLTVLDPSEEDRVKYGLMKKVVDKATGKVDYVYDAPYVVTFKRTTPVEENSKEKINFLQTIYIAPKPNSTNYYTFTVITILDSNKNLPADLQKSLKLSTLCEVSGDTFNFLKYNDYDWTYPYVLQTGIKYTTDLTISKPGYSATFKIDNQVKDDTNAIAIMGSATDGKTADTFGMLTFVTGTKNDPYYWYITQTDAKIYNKDGKEFKPSTGRYKANNAVGERVTCFTEKIDVYDGVINQVQVDPDFVTVWYANGTKVEKPRYQTTIFKKLFQSVNALAIINQYTLTAEEEKALISDSSKLLATITLTDNNGDTMKVECYDLAELGAKRKAYIVVNGEGGYYVHKDSIQTIFDNVEKFFDKQDINNN